MEKSREAFRTISEVAEWLDVPTHVLRFWESRFSQIKPVKRAGGRRYYRPSDMRVIGGVKTLLHDQGMTIRGVQKLFREEGIKHVSSFSPAIYGADADDDASDTIEHQRIETPASEPATPAPAARSTREATPAPISAGDTSDAGHVFADANETQFGTEDTSEDVHEVSDDVEEGSEAGLFDDDPDTDEADATAGEPEVPTGEQISFRHSPVSRPAAHHDPEPEPEPEAPPAPTIPPTPDVPMTDPADDTPGYPGVPGISARIVTARRASLRPHRDTLENVVKTLKDIRGRRA